MPGLVGWRWVLAACCPGLVALPERSEGQGAAWRHLAPWVGGPEQSLLAATLSGHVGAAEAKNCGGGRYRGPRPPGRAGQVPQQACSHRLGQGSCRPTWVGDASNPQSWKLYRLPKVQQALTSLPPQPCLWQRVLGREAQAGRGAGSRSPCQNPRVLRVAGRVSGNRAKVGGSRGWCPVSACPSRPHLAPPHPWLPAQDRGAECPLLGPWEGTFLPGDEVRLGWPPPAEPRTSLAGPGWALVDEQHEGGS